MTGTSVTSTAGTRVSIRLSCAQGWLVEPVGPLGRAQPAPPSPSAEPADRLEPAAPGRAESSDTYGDPGNELIDAAPARAEQSEPIDGEPPAHGEPSESVDPGPPARLDLEPPAGLPAGRSPEVELEPPPPTVEEPLDRDPEPDGEPALPGDLDPEPEGEPALPGDLDPPGAPGPPSADLAPPPRPVVAVVGLATGCGTSTVARWLAAGLAARDPDGAAIVSTPAPRGAGALRTAAAARLARGLGARSIEPVRAAGKLCLVDSTAHSPLSIAATYLAPLVLDIGHDASSEAALSVADHVVLVASPGVEPALATLVAQSIGRSAAEPTVLLNRAVDEVRWDARADVVLPDSRLAARRASLGREPRGTIGATLADLAAALEGSLWE